MSDYINENLLGASPYKNQAAESKKLVNKWEKTGLLDGLNQEFQKSGMAVMLENQAKQLISEATYTGGGASGVTAGAGGGIFSDGSSLEMSNVQINNNSATVQGGGIYFRSGADPWDYTLDIDSSYINGNGGYASGGGVYIAKSPGGSTIPIVQFSNTTVSNNICSNNGS